MNFRRLSENNLAVFLQKVKDLLGGDELSAIGAGFRAELWDEIGLPYEDQKQESGDTLRIIGFDIDPNAMSVTIEHFTLSHTPT